VRPGDSSPIKANGPRQSQFRTGSTRKRGLIQMVRGAGNGSWAWCLLSCTFVLCLSFQASGFDDKDKEKAKNKAGEKDQPQLPVEVNEW
jgi:hypothetical protein